MSSMPAALHAPASGGSGSHNSSLLFAADFCASWTSYCIALAASYPLDTLRVKLQNATGSNGGVVALLKRDGVRCLYSGIHTPAIANGPVVATIFSLNEYFRTVYRGLNVSLLGNAQVAELPHFTHGELFLAGATAGAISSVLSTPASFLKIQQQVRAGRNAKVPGAMAIAREVVTHHGVGGLFRGVTCETFSTSIGRAVYFTAYEELKEFLLARAAVLSPAQPAPSTTSPSCSSSSSSPPSQLNSPAQQHQHHQPQQHAARASPAVTILASFTAGALTSSVGWLAIYHTDSIKVRLMGDFVDPARRRFPQRYFASWHCALDTYRTRGVLGFYRGLHLTLVKSWVSSGLSLPLFDYFKPRYRAAVLTAASPTSAAAASPSSNGNGGRDSVDLDQETVIHDSTAASEP